MTVYLNELGMVCALGADLETVRRNLAAATSPGYVQTDRYSPGRSMVLGAAVVPPLPPLELPLRLQSRNNMLLAAALHSVRPTVDALRSRVDPARIAVIIGTSTSGMEEAENAVHVHRLQGALPAGFHYGQQELGSPAAFLSELLETRGPSYGISTACSSSAKAIASGARLLEMRVVDAAIVGGVDTLCRFTVAGFSVLGAVSAARCNPFSRNRCGVNIGEGAALFVMTRDAGEVKLSGWGDASDGYHISAPDPQGGGARLAIMMAMRRAQLTAEDIGYVNLHGTGTQQNDAMESRVMHELLPQVPASSTKPLTGHALGAAGAIEAGICWLTLTAADGCLPPHLWDGEADPQLPALRLVAPGTRLRRAPRAVLSSSFAFGGSNAALVLSRP